MSEAQETTTVTNPCRLCGHSRPTSEANRCNACTAYQRGWRRWMPLSPNVQALTWWVAVASAIVGAVPFVVTQCKENQDRNSRTEIAFARTDTSGDHVLVYAHLSNGGRQPSTIRAYQLLLPEAHVNDANVFPFVTADHEFHALVPPRGEFTAPLDVPDIHAGKFSRIDVLAALRKAHAQLRAEIKESDGTVHWVESLPFPAELLRGVVQRRLVEENR